VDGNEESSAFDTYLDDHAGFWDDADAFKLTWRQRWTEWTLGVVARAV